MHRHSLKAVTATVAAVVVLFVMAAPSSATANSGTVTGGTVYSNITPPISEPIGGGTGPCSGGGSSSVTLDLTGSAPNRTSSVTSANFARGSFEHAGNDYTLDLYLDSSGTGSVTGSSSPYVVASQEVAFVGEIYTDPNADCGATGSPSLACEFYLELTLSGSVTTPSAIPSSNVVPTGSTTDLDGSGTPATGICNAPFTTLNSNTAGVNGLEVTF